MVRLPALPFTTIWRVALSIAVVACMVMNVPLSSHAEPARQAKVSSSTSALRIGFLQGMDIDSLNPYIGYNDASYVFYGMVYDSLMSIGNDMGVVPNLAKSWWAVPNDTGDPDMVGMPYGSVWQYNLTHDAYWSDGEPFTADDVVWNIWLNAAPTHYTQMWAFQPYSYYMKEAKKIDNYTVRIYFWDRATGEPKAASYAYMLSIPMLPAHLLQGWDFSAIGINWTGVFTDAESPGMPIVSTGPFMATPDIYSQWIAAENITLVRNPYCHWGPDYGKYVNYDEIVLEFFADPTSMVLALENKEIDVAEFPSTAYQAIKSDVETHKVQNITTFDGPKITQYWTEVAFCMNPDSGFGTNPARLDPVIRQALHMATNKQYIVDNQYLGFADPGTTIIPPINEYWHYQPTASEMFNYNLTAAANLLTANGYVDIDDDGIRECTISSPAVEHNLVPENTKLVFKMEVRKEYPEEKLIAQYLQGEWASIGVQLNIQVYDEVKLATDAYSHKYDTLIWYWSGDIDPNYQLFVLSTQAIGGWSDNMYSNPAYDQNYSLSVQTLDKAQRKVHVDNCQRIFYNDSAYIVLAYAHQTYAWRDDTFTGWGNWTADPGRSLDNYWTGNPLLFDLQPLPDVEPPVAIASVTPNPATEGSLITLNGSASTDDSGSIADYNWTFEYSGTGLELHGAVVLMVFSIPGYYNITLNCTDASGNYNTTTVELIVIPAIPEFASMPLVVMVMLMAVVVTKTFRRSQSHDHR
jgi:peptide/nickel transport system substrate-binding protein